MTIANAEKYAPAEANLTGTGLSGKTAVVTGASSGVGVAIAGALAEAGAAVTLAVRDVVAGRLVAEGIAAGRASVPPSVRHIDLLDLDSVRSFAKEWGDQPLDILINNAGLMAPPFTLTVDGFESQMAVNYFAPFLLSELLVPALTRAAPARVVIVSSGSHHLAKLRLDDLNYAEREYDRFEAYGHAKLCANLLAVEFSRRHGGSGITMNAVTPGGVMTNLGRHCTFEDAVRLGWVKTDGSLPQGRIKSPEEGAASPVWAAVAPELAGRGGLYIEDCEVAPIWTPEIPPGWAVTKDSLDASSAQSLWEVAAPLIGIKAP